MSEELIEAPGRRVFETGATRDTDAGKPDYEGFLSPLVIEAFGRYMSKNRPMCDGTIRDSDNWQKGIPLPAYAKSGWRHFMEWWKLHRGYEAAVDVEEAICGLLFNAMGYLHEHLKGRLLRRLPQPDQALILTNGHRRPDTPVPATAVAMVVLKVDDALGEVPAAFERASFSAAAA